MLVDGAIWHGHTGLHGLLVSAKRACERGWDVTKHGDCGALRTQARRRRIPRIHVLKVRTVRILIFLAVAALATWTCARALNGLLALACHLRWAVAHHQPLTDTSASIHFLTVALQVALGVALVRFPIWRLTNLRRWSTRATRWMLAIAVSGALVHVAAKVAADARDTASGDCEQGAPVLRGPKGVHFPAFRSEPAFDVHIGAAGVRGRAPQSGDWLIVGDSFTFGTGLSDDDTVPMAFQRASGWPAANLGMQGDNLNGAVARAARVLSQLQPRAFG